MQAGGACGCGLRCVRLQAGHMRLQVRAGLSAAATSDEVGRVEELAASGLEAACGGLAARLDLKADVAQLAAAVSQELVATHVPEALAMIDCKANVADVNRSLLEVSHPVQSRLQPVHTRLQPRAYQAAAPCHPPCNPGCSPTPHPPCNVLQVNRELSQRPTLGELNRAAARPNAATHPRIAHAPPQRPARSLGAALWTHERRACAAWRPRMEAALWRALLMPAHRRRCRLRASLQARGQDSLLYNTTQPIQSCPHACSR